MSDQRAEAVADLANSLVYAVADRDADRIADLLATEPDWPALVVVLADLAGRGPSQRYVDHVIAEVQSGRPSKAVAARYGITTTTVRRLAEDNRPGPDRESPDVLTCGRWVRRGLIRVWVDDESEAA